MANNDEFEEEIPRWDPALALMVTEEAHNLGRGLSLDDFRRLANQHAIRFDDIVLTMLELTAAQRWRYQPAKPGAPALDEETIEKLKERGRLTDADLVDFDGTWQLA